MIEIGSRQRTQPAPPAIIYAALVTPHRDTDRPWLQLLDDELPPVVLESIEPTLVVWSSLWSQRPDAVIRFDITAAGGGSSLRWTLTTAEPVPDDGLRDHQRRRINELINAGLRLSFGQ